MQCNSVVAKVDEKACIGPNQIAISINHIRMVGFHLAEGISHPVEIQLQFCRNYQKDSEDMFGLNYISPILPSHCNLLFMIPTILHYCTI